MKKPNKDNSIETNNNAKPTRRSFIKDAALSTLAVCCLSGNLREAFAQSKRAGKPLLTEESLNKWLKTLTNEKVSALSPLTRAKLTNDDLKNFLKEYFEIMPEQEQRIDWLTNDDLKALGEVSKKFVKKGEFMEVYFTAPNSNKNSSLMKEGKRGNRVSVKSFDSNITDGQNLKNTAKGNSTGKGTGKGGGKGGTSGGTTGNGNTGGTSGSGSNNGNGNGNTVNVTVWA